MGFNSGFKGLTRHFTRKIPCLTREIVWLHLLNMKN